jgi:O-antigen/teichoic acid export membrane protein
VVCQPVFTHLYGVNGAIAALALSFAVQFVLGGAFLWRGSRHSRQELPESAKGYALYSWLAAVVSAVVWTRAEIFFLNHYSTSREAGYFSVALTFASLINIAAGLLTGALMPHFTTAVANSDTKELQTSYRRMTLFVAACVFPIGIGGATVMPELLPLVFGKSFVAAVRPAQILMISGVLAFAGVGSSLIYATGRSKFIFCSSCVGALLIVSGCPFVSDHYGASGVAYVRLSVQIIMIGVGTIFIRKILNISLPYAGMARIALASLLASAVAWLVMQLHLPASAVWAVIVAIAAYPTCLKLTKPLGSEDTAAVLDNENMVPALLRLKLKWMIL